MFFKNNTRPAYAGAGLRNASQSAPTSDSFMRSTSETDDFGAFNTAGMQQQRPNGARRAPQQRPQKSSGLKSSSIVVAIAAVVVVVLLIILIAAVAGGSGKNITYEDNAYIAYMDSDGIYHVAVNGTVVGDYENEVSLIPADDHSFAYIIESSAEGYIVHLIEGKKATRITDTAVDKVLATASLTPGVVWLEADNGIYYYTDGKDERITKDYDTLVEDRNNASDDLYNYLCFMSADASTVTYAKYDEEKGNGVFNLYTYSDSSEQKSQKNLFPAAISDDGSLIYGYGYSSKDGITKMLYVVTPDDKFNICEGFNSIVGINPEGNEIVYTTSTDAGITTYIFAFNPKKLDSEAAPAKIAKGYFTPVIIDPEVARLSTFKNTYFEAQSTDLDITAATPTYYVNKKYEATKVAGYAGKFDPNGKYFFYINDNGKLLYIDLDDDQYNGVGIEEDIVDFEVTQKGNVYWLNDSDRLSYYNVSKDENQRIRDDVAEISMHNYSNKLYFQLTDSVTVYCTEEGSKEDDVKFDSTSIAGTPIFAKANLKKTFAAVYDYDNDEWRIYYTSNGRSYKFIGACIDIDGFDASDILDNISGNLPG